MSRRLRVVMPNVPLHVIQRGNDRVACFYSENDYLFYLESLTELACKYGCKVHAFCLMTNHVYLLLSPGCIAGAGLLMKGLGQRYVLYVNRTYRRTGTLWEGRFRSCLVQEDGYVLACYRYIELNPVRAKMVEHPAEYRWSSYRVNAQNESSALITPHANYYSLGGSVRARSENYLELFKMDFASELIDQIRASTNGNYVLGGSKFASDIGLALGRRVTCGVAGRPQKQT
ncbi:transposase [Pseudomonas sp. DOAB1069]|uniref:Transposase n=2 Tax=Pseudomonas folii TaxID=2762593 RepID=A0ABR7B661_9PSED|nr:transposase [Pseudomonas folii]